MVSVTGMGEEIPDDAERSGLTPTKEATEREGLASRLEEATVAAYSSGAADLLAPLRVALAAIGEPVSARESRAVAGALLVSY